MTTEPITQAISHEEARKALTVDQMKFVTKDLPEAVGWMNQTVNEIIAQGDFIRAVSIITETDFDTCETLHYVIVRPLPVRRKP